MLTVPRVNRRTFPCEQLSSLASGSRIRAARSGQVEGKHRSEFRYGSFTRTLELPPGADADGVTAEYTDGILTIRAAVKEEEQETMKRDDRQGRLLEARPEPGPADIPRQPEPPRPSTTRSRRPE